jgi:uncharacterized membrane protein
MGDRWFCRGGGMRVSTARELFFFFSLSSFFGFFTLVPLLVLVIILFLVVARDTQPSLPS